MKFLCNGTNKRRKWALVKWKIVCTPKHQGGLGLRDPKHENVVSGAKLWWRWVTHAQEPWEKMWHIKYDEGWDRRDLIRFSEDTLGYHILQTSWMGRMLV